MRTIRNECCVFLLAKTVFFTQLTITLSEIAENRSPGGFRPRGIRFWAQNRCCSSIYLSFFTFKIQINHKNIEKITFLVITRRDYNGFGRDLLEMKPTDVLQLLEQFPTPNSFNLPKLLQYEVPEKIETN